MSKSTLVIMLSVYAVFAAEANSKVTKEYDLFYFILGSLNDYMGRSIERSPSEFRYCYVDDIHCKKEAYKTFLDSLLRANNAQNGKDIDYRFVESEIDTTNAEGCEGFYYLCSSELADFVNDKYCFKVTRASTENGCMTFSGVLLDNLFSSKIEELSFLAGAFAFHGTINELGKLGFNFGNSIRKYETVVNILYKNGCIIEEERTSRMTVPIHRAFLFSSGSDVREYLLPVIKFAEKVKSK